jgi:hypothetical protein
MKPLVEAENRQVLADTFRSLVRYPLSKRAADPEKLGVIPGNFSVKAVDSSLAAAAMELASLETVLRKAREGPVTFHFHWNAPERRAAAFALSWEPDGDLKVRLLWMDLPERIPVARSAAFPGGPNPIEEAVTELLRVDAAGRLTRYPKPK